ncbi:MAG: hypothetical protein EP343_30810 [Deltaproteobacteria bacterium]|nr:MAG: hypothetical protein EP343_30810 [Deltaproteobacteria bacterium]
MKSLIKWMFVALVWVGFASQAQAKCSWWYLSTLPKKGEKHVPMNVKPFFAIYGYKRNVALGLLKRGVLVGGMHKVSVKVNVMPSSSSSFQMLYVVLEPTQALKANTLYKLVLPEALKPNKQSNTSWIRKDLTEFSFTTGSRVDREAPKTFTSIKSQGYKKVRFGCGPARTIRMKVEGRYDDQTPVKKLRYVYNVTWTHGKQSKSFVVHGDKAWGDEVSLGHGMCSGNFHAFRTGTYTIQVKSVDYAGNESGWSKPVVTKVP